MQDMKSIETAAHDAVMRGVSSALSELGGKASPRILGAAPVVSRSKTTSSAPRTVAAKKAPVATKPAKVKAEKAPKVAKPVGASKAKGEKRNPVELETLVNNVAAAIQATPGMGVEQLGKALGKPTKELGLPIKKLIKLKQITTKGQKRATRYFPR